MGVHTYPMTEPPDTNADKLAAYLAGRRDLKRIERSNAGKVLRRFAKQLSRMGYHRRSTYFARETGQIIQFLHLHKFTFGPKFRMHVCIRVLNETLDFVALTGITNEAFKLSFEDNDASFDTHGIAAHITVTPLTH